MCIQGGPTEALLNLSVKVGKVVLNQGLLYCKTRRKGTHFADCHTTACYFGDFVLYKDTEIGGCFQTLTKLAETCLKSFIGERQHSKTILSFFRLFILE